MTREIRVDAKTEEGADDEPRRLGFSEEHRRSRGDLRRNLRLTGDDARAWEELEAEHGGTAAAARHLIKLLPKRREP